MAAWVYKIWNGGASANGGTELGHVILSDSWLDPDGVRRYDSVNKKKGEKASQGYHKCKNPQAPKPGDVLSVKGLTFRGGNGNFDFPAIYHAAEGTRAAGFYYRSPEPGRGNGDWEATDGGTGNLGGKKRRTVRRTKTKKVRK